MLVAIALCAVGSAVPERAEARSSTTSSAKKQRAKERKALVRATKRDPKVVTKPWFLRKAQLFGLDLPITIRLTPAANQAGTPVPSFDDVIQIDLGTTATGGPPPDGVAPGVVQSTLKGSIRGSLRFSQDPAGYGQLGTVELGFGDIQMTGTAFDLVHDAAPGGCTDPALLRAIDPITITEAQGSRGFVNLFGGTFSMSVHTVFAFSSEVRPICTDLYSPTSYMDGSGRPPLPIRLDGRMRISPALTADGRVRLGKLSLDGTQADSYVQVHSCTTGPPPPATCASGSDATMEGRLMATSFTAELLIGAAG